MTPTRRTSITAILASAALWTCGPSPEDRIAEALYGHLSAVAPNGLQHDDWSDVTVDVLESAAAEDGAIEVRFRVFNPKRITSETDTVRGPVYVAHMVEDAGGYGIVRYGEDLARSVAVMVAVDRRHRYEDLLDPFLVLKDSIRMTISAWSKVRRNEARDGVTDARWQEIVAELDARIPADTLRDGLAARWTAPEGLEWGVIAEGPGGGSDVAYLRVADEPSEICAYRIGIDTPEGHSWLEGAYPTCRGRKGVYVEQYPPESILTEIRASGMVLRPGG